MPPIHQGYKAVLDLGCGAGQTLITSPLAVDATAVGVDVDLSALRLGKELDKRIRFVCGRGEDLPFKSECFDFVYSRVALPYMHLGSSLSEMWRVLKVGGGIWIVLHTCRMALKDLWESFVSLNAKRTAYRIYVFVNGLLMHLFQTEIHLPFNTNRYESFQTIKGISRALSAAGFINVQVEKDSFFVATARKA